MPAGHCQSHRKLPPSPTLGQRVLLLLSRWQGRVCLQLLPLARPSIFGLARAMQLQFRARSVHGAAGSLPRTPRPCHLHDCPGREGSRLVWLAQRALWLVKDGGQVSLLEGPPRASQSEEVLPPPPRTNQQVNLCCSGGRVCVGGGGEIA